MKVTTFRGKIISDDSEQPFKEENLRKIFEKIEAGFAPYPNRSIDEDVKKMAAIGLWMWKNHRIDWPGNRAVYLRLFTTRAARLSDFLDREGAASCVDKAFMTKALAQEMGLKGEVKRVKRGPLDKVLGVNKMHHYFQTDSGIVGDFVWHS